MELELTLEASAARSPESYAGLRVVDTPLSAIATTWAMDLSQEELPLPKPAGPCKILGFWNDMPEEEQRDVVELMPPTYGKKLSKEGEHMVVDIKEMATVLIGIYLLLALIHLGIIIGRL